MIEATCAACGTVNRIVEADVPAGAKFVSCTSCKSKVQLATKGPAIPALPKLSPPGKPMAIPAIPTKIPTPPKGVPSPGAKPLDLADLPAPKRQSPLAGADASGPKPAPRSPLSGAELPVPKSAAKPPVPQAGALDLDDLMAPHESPGLADLPAPKSAPRAALADLPAPKSAPRAALADLPAPKGKTPAVGVPKPAALADLPAPKSKTPAAGVPRPGAAAASGPMKKPAPGLTDLPDASPGAGGTLELDDLDLPMPKPGVTDLPTPKAGATDLPAPKGFFDDLPQPARKNGGSAGGIDLPAPKGFFDDLPQPASNAVKTQDVAPKGFFDDLPQPASSAAKTQDLAPKGFFDDLPGPSVGASQELAPKAGAAAGGLPEVTAQGLFDDLPEPSQGGAGLFDDLQDPAGTNPATAALGAGDIDLGPSLGPGLELDTSGPELDLGLPLGQDEAFSDLDLSEPTRSPPPAEPSPIKIKTPAKGAERKPIPITVPPAKGGDLKLDLAEDPHAGKGAPAAVAVGGPKITPKKKAAAAEASPEARAAKRRRTRLVLASLLGIAALGAGGFFFYQRHAAQQAKEAEIAAQLDKAQKALGAADVNHWDRARTAAVAALELDSTNARAIGIAAEAMIAGAMDTGRNYDALIVKGRGMIQDALGAGRPSPELERAQAVSAIAAKGQAQRAIDLLKAQIGKAPKDGWLHLYMGWAQLAKGDAAEAIKAFEQAATLTPAAKISALYGQGRGKLLLADVAGARTAFAAILEAQKDHVCANIGLIATMPPSESTQQVAELEAVLQRKDIATADPRCRVQAITMIGDVYRAAGRLDMARQRYRDALKLVPLDQPTHNGLAAIELRDDKLTVAADHIQKALAVNAGNPDTLLLQADLHIREGKLPDAEKLIEQLAAHQPPLPTLAQARLHVVKGRLLETKGQPVDAVEEYTKGAGLAGDLDLTPTMEAVRTLSELARKEADPAKAKQLRDRADQLLSAIAARAQEDAQLSATLGIAYLQAGDPAKAEVFLRRSVAMKEDDPDARLQLARAFNAQQKTDDALAQLTAAQQLDGTRIDIALELARTYQSAGRHDEAIAAYDKLLGAEDVPSVVRVKAGRYFAERGLVDKAAAQAEPILAAEPENPGGLYLKAEGLLQADKPEEAAPILVKASDLDPDAQYLDALGRALEGQLRKSKDTKYIEGARFAYERASKADPTMFHPWLGQGRMLVARRDWEPAINALQQASSLNKDHPEVRYYMGVAYHGLRANPKYRGAAAGWLESALKARPELDIALRAEAAYMLGQLYADLNKLADQARSLATATRLGEDIEKQTGVAPPWLTESYYDLGDCYYKQGNPSAQKRAFQRFVDRKPQDSVRLKRALHDLATTLQRQ